MCCDSHSFKSRFTQSLTEVKAEANAVRHSVSSMAPVVTYGLSWVADPSAQPVIEQPSAAPTAAPAREVVFA